MPFWKRSCWKKPCWSVGDVTVATLLELGVVPDVGFIDGQTKRTALDEASTVDVSAFQQVIHAHNPPGSLRLPSSSR